MVFERIVVVVGSLSRRKNEGTFGCPKCSYTFTHRTNMFRHLRLIHGIGRGPLKMYRCDFCGFETKFKANLRQHEMNVHKMYKDS